MELVYKFTKKTKIGWESLFDVWSVNYFLGETATGRYDSWLFAFTDLQSAKLSKCALVDPKEVEIDLLLCNTEEMKVFPLICARIDNKSLESFWSNFNTNGGVPIHMAIPALAGTVLCKTITPIHQVENWK